MPITLERLKKKVTLICWSWVGFDYFLGSKLQTLGSICVMTLVIITFLKKEKKKDKDSYSVNSFWEVLMKVVTWKWVVPQPSIPNVPIWSDLVQQDKIAITIIYIYYFTMLLLLLNYSPLLYYWPPAYSNPPLFFFGWGGWARFSDQISDLFLYCPCLLCL